MTPRSLRVRLLGGAAIAIFVALAVAWILMTLLFERHIERRVEVDLTRNGLQLVAALKLAPDGRPFADQHPSDPRFDEPASGLYWQLSTAAGVLQSRSLWDETLPGSTVAGAHGWKTRLAQGPFDQQLLLVEREVRPDSQGAAVLVQLAHDREALRAASAEFGRELGLFLLILWAILAAAAWLQVHLGLRPLARVRDDLAALQRNPSARLTAGHALEIEPLVNAINALAAAREQDLERARHRAADLAHGLKTPLAALAAQSRRAREAGATEAADGLDRAITAATTVVAGELARARVATIRSTRSPQTSPRESIEALIGVLEHTEFGATLVFEVDVADELRLPVAVKDLNELIGPLLENAARFARRRVRVTGATEPESMLSIEEDGPGMVLAQAEALIKPGGRLDEAGTRRGRGLLIARDIAEATNGRITMGSSELGGLQVSITWSRTLAVVAPS